MDPRNLAFVAIVALAASSRALHAVNAAINEPDELPAPREINPFIL